MPRVPSLLPHPLLSLLLLLLWLLLNNSVSAGQLLLGSLFDATMLTDVDGRFVMTGVPPNYENGQQYGLRFSAPGAGSRTALLGETDSDFTDGLQRIDDIVVQGGSNLRDLNLPIDPNGVVYDSIGRTPIAGAVLTLVDGRTSVAMPSSCFDDPRQQGQVTLANGYYKFDLNFADPACAEGALYTIQVTPPGSNYVGGVSELIPPASSLATAPFDVPACPGSADDAIPATAQHCEAQASEFAPPTSVGARSAGTVYHSLLRLDGTQQPGSAQLFNNHIPLDPRLDGAIAITKTTSLVNVSRGQMVPYTITVSNSFNADLADVTIVDRFPPGFRYVDGSARIDGVKTIVAYVTVFDNVGDPVEGATVSGYCFVDLVAEATAVTDANGAFEIIPPPALMVTSRISATHRDFGPSEPMPVPNVTMITTPARPLAAPNSTSAITRTVSRGNGSRPNTADFFIRSLGLPNSTRETSSP